MDSPRTKLKPSSIQANRSSTLMPVSAVQRFGSVVILRHQLMNADYEPIDLAALNLRLSVCSNIDKLLGLADSRWPTCLIAYACGTEDCGLKAYKIAKASGLSIPAVFIGVKNNLQLAIDAMRSGAVDFILQPIIKENLVASVMEALEQSLRTLKQNESTFDLRHRAETLTLREKKVVKLVISGLLNKEIALRLHVAEITVKVYRGRAMHKLGARTSAELARIGLSLGL